MCLTFLIQINQHGKLNIAEKKIMLTEVPTLIKINFCQKKTF